MDDFSDEDLILGGIVVLVLYWLFSNTYLFFDRTTKYFKINKALQQKNAARGSVVTIDPRF